MKFVARSCRRRRAGAVSWTRVRWAARVRRVDAARAGRVAASPAV